MMLVVVAGEDLVWWVWWEGEEGHACNASGKATGGLDWFKREGELVIRVFYFIF